MGLLLAVLFVVLVFTTTETAGYLTLLRLQRAWTMPNYTQGAAALYPGLRAGCPFGALLLIFVHQTVHPKNLHKPDFANALQSYHLTR